MSNNTDDSLYQEHDFVICQASYGKEVRIPFGDKTLEEFQTEVAQQLYPHMMKETSPNATPQTLRLIWCGKELQPGCSWHTPVTLKTKMKDLNPNCKNGLPMILAHATGGTDFPENDEQEEEGEGGIQYSYSPY